MQFAGFQPAERVSLQSIEAAPACRPLNRVQPTFGVGKVCADLGSSVMKVEAASPRSSSTRPWKARGRLRPVP
jgi:hypothetical protein